MLSTERRTQYFIADSYYFHQRGYVFVGVTLLVSGMAQKPLDRFSRNSVAHGPRKKPLG